ncbi:MAG TPA: DMT family transporter [Terriglobales bacterium]|nr:DMT family transporter [Terriglobales bacterium]
MPSSKGVGTAFGLIGMTSFSLTLPATRLAVRHFHPMVVGLGRPVIAACLAALLLALTKSSFPPRQYWKNFALVVIGVVFGVPLTFAWGMYTLPASHGAITLALLPLATALVATIRAGERPSPRFWLATAVGSMAVLAYALLSGAGKIVQGDWILFLSVAASALGYAEGARLTRVLSGWQVMSWALVIGAPFLIVPLVFAIRAYGLHGPPSAWAGFGYVCVVSQWLGMFAWYKGLAAGGISRIGQLQLLQPFCTVFFSAVLLGETVSLAMIVAAAVVVGSVALGRTAAIEIASESAARVSE